MQAQVRQGAQWLRRWDNCIIAYRHDDGTYEVEYADGTMGEGIPAYRIRPPPKGVVIFMQDDRIKAMRNARGGASGGLHDAVVVRQEADGRYLVKFDDGVGNGNDGAGQKNTPAKAMELVSSRYFDYDDSAS